MHLLRFAELTVDLGSLTWMGGPLTSCALQPTLWFSRMSSEIAESPVKGAVQCATSQVPGPSLSFIWCPYKDPPMQCSTFEHEHTWRCPKPGSLGQECCHGDSCVFPGTSGRPDEAPCLLEPAEVEAGGEATLGQTRRLSPGQPY